MHSNNVRTHIFLGSMEPRLTNTVKQIYIQKLLLYSNNLSKTILITEKTQLYVITKTDKYRIKSPSSDVRENRTNNKDLHITYVNKTK
jgi:hypothetical protein